MRNCIFIYLKYKIKKCPILHSVFSHNKYSFSIIIITMIILIIIIIIIAIGVGGGFGWSGGVVLGGFGVGRDLGGMGRENRTPCSWSGVVLGVWVVGRGGFGWFLGR